MKDFFQEGPSLAGNTYEQDRFVQAYLNWRLPKPLLAVVHEDLMALGQKAQGPYLELAREAQRELPVHVPFDAWGVRQDLLRTSSAWQKFHRISAEEGLVAIGYAREQGGFSRLYQFAKLYVFHPSSAFYTCPLAMADGAARVMEVYASPEVKKRFYPHLTTRNPDTFWTSGQWMTEKTGGSDVGRTLTTAREVKPGAFELTGVKWFCSATTSQMAVGLARPEGAVEGSRGLSLFAMEAFDQKGRFNRVKVLRLKDKMGTKALPTAELELNGIPAVMVGSPGQGVKTVATMLNITRLYNSICAVGQCERVYQIARNYSLKREAFGEVLKDHPLHMETLADYYYWWSLGSTLTFELAYLLGRDETGEATEGEKAVLRLLTPVAKLYTGKLAVAFTSEVLECFGGAGYMEDTEIPLLFRDAQVFPIWEGTTNVLSLDVLRVLRSPENLELYFGEVQSRLKAVQTHKEERVQVESTLAQLKHYAQWMGKASEEEVQAGARTLAWNLGEAFAAATLLKMAEELKDARLKAWCEVLLQRMKFRTPLALRTPSQEQVRAAEQLVLL
ncbi:MAG: acyl-CoA dehydrogenase family protein [Bdellovibrionales bacterium]|nr:acyl-CoA dehydrogenase family protein [Bdellovibrionales bacterium]